MTRLYILTLAWYISHFANAQQSEILSFNSEVFTGSQAMYYRGNSVTSGQFIYICGTTVNSSDNYDVLLSKFDRFNQLVWEVSYNGAFGGNDFGARVSVNSSGEVFVVGSSQTGTSNYDALVLKYSAAGTLLFASNYGGSAGLADGFLNLHPDGSGGVVCVGGVVNSISQLTNGLIVRFNSTGGQIWASTWNNSSTNLEDTFNLVRVANGQVSVSGLSQISASPIGWSMVRMGYQLSNGQMLGSAIVGNNQSNFESVSDILMSETGEVYVAGFSNVQNQGRNFRVSKFSGSLSQLWTYTFNGSSNQDDEALSISLVSGVLLASGYTTTNTQGKNALYVRLNTTTGAAVWTQERNFFGGDDVASVIRVHPNGGEAYIGGNALKHGNKDMYVSRIRTSNGAEMSTAWYNGIMNLNESVDNVAIDEDGSIFVHGQEETSPGQSYKYVLTKWVVNKVNLLIPPSGFTSAEGFLPNKGQIRNVGGSSNQSIQYYSNGLGSPVYLGDTTIHFVRHTSLSDSLYDVQRVDFKFKKTVSDKRWFPANEMDHYVNFIQGHMPNFAMKTPVYNTVFCPGIYTGIDAVMTGSQGGWGLNFVLAGGADGSDIELEISGQDSLSIDALGNLHIYTNLGDFEFQAPVVRALNLTSGSLTPSSSNAMYSLVGNTLTLNISSWTGAIAIELSPFAALSGGGGSDNMLWSTYFGGFGDEELTGVEVRPDGGFATCGYVMIGDFPWFNAFQNSIQGEMCPVLVSFNSQYSLDFSTYYGGASAFEATGTDVVYLDQGRILMAGFTNAQNLPMATTPVYPIYDSSPNGGIDGFLAMFNQNGFLVWSTYYGTSGTNEVINDLTTDSNGAVFICGSGASGMPVVPLGYSLPGNPGTSGGFVAKFSPQMQLEWQTTVGNNTLPYSVVCDELDRLYLIGDTESNPGLVTFNSGNYSLFDATPNGQSDVFLMRFNADFSLDYSSYIGGSGTDNLPFYAGNCAEVSNGKILLGFTTSSTGLPAAVNAPGSPILDPIGDSDVYLMLLNLDFGLIWASYWGGTSLDEIRGLKLTNDEAPRVLVYTGSADIPVTPFIGAYSQPQVDSREAYILDYDTNMEVEWSTYLGGISEGADGDQPFDFAIDPENRMVIVGSTSDIPGFMEPNTFPLQQNFDFYFDPLFTFPNPPISTAKEGWITVFETDFLTYIELQRQGQSTIAPYPNPVQNTLNFTFPNLPVEEVLLRIFDQQGKIVRNLSLNPSSNFSLEVGDLSSGLYVITVSSAGKFYQSTFVKL
ncbi:MAG: T9SS type A sorting domain-containing protein [Flavobacteriales bacterium]|jgi:hypothetical protein